MGVQRPPRGGSLAVFDPLLPAGAAPVNRSVAYMAAWLNGVGGNQVREVRRDEFAAAAGADPMIESLNGFNFSNAFNVVPAHIAINPNRRTGFIDGPDEGVTQLQGFSY